jgi:hypothetical protein
MKYLFFILIFFVLISPVHAEERFISNNTNGQTKISTVCIQGVLFVVSISNQNNNISTSITQALKAVPRTWIPQPVECN